MTTWKLTLHHDDGTDTVRTGLSHDETLRTLADLVYGTWDDEPRAAEQADTHLVPLAA